MNDVMCINVMLSVPLSPNTKFYSEIIFICQCFFDNQWNKPYIVKKLQNHDNFKTLIIQHFQEFYVLLIR